MATVSVKNTGQSVPGWAVSVERWYVYSSSLTCQQGEAQFLALPLEQKLAQTFSAKPSAGVAKKWLLRTCGSTDAGETFVSASNDDYVPAGSETPPDNPVTETGFDTTYSFSYSGPSVDFVGTAIKTSPSARLTAVSQTKPRLLGNYRDFEPQTALNVVVHERIGLIAVHASKILIYPGGLYSNTANDLIGRPWTHVSESAKWPGGTYPVQFKRALETAFYNAAYEAAQVTSGPDTPSPEQKQKLLDWAGPYPTYEGTHILIDDEATCILYAKKWYPIFKQLDWKGGGVEYFSINHEVNTERNGGNRYQQWYTMEGWLAKAIINLAAAESVTLKTGFTDFGNLCHPRPSFFADPYNGDPNLPEYMSYTRIEEPFRGTSQNDPIGNSTVIAKLLLAGKGFTGTGSYLQHTFDEQDLFETNNDGSLKVVSGELIWRTDKRTTTITGQSCVIYRGDTYDAMVKRYELEARDMANVFFRSGSQHLALSSYRKTGYEQVRFSSQFRLDVEVQSGIDAAANGLSGDEANSLNSRPLNPDWVRDNAVRMYLNTDYVRGWMETQEQTALGADNNKSSKARASAEVYADGFKQAANLNWIFDTPYQPLEPKLWIYKNYADHTSEKYEQFYRKPILRGGLAIKDGHPTIWMRGVAPWQGVGRFTDVLIWGDNGAGLVTPSYKLRLPGRKTILDYWTIGDQFAACCPNTSMLSSSIRSARPSPGALTTAKRALLCTQPHRPWPPNPPHENET